MAEEAVSKKVEIIKRRNDKRQYRRIVLANKLEVLLISDPDTDKCAASMDVGVGSFSDPEGLEGLAHFLEHMLFYASAKYPIEDSYSKYITEHGGSADAFTSSEHTNYFFDVNPDGFEEALNRFSQFFIEPLMSDDAITREIKAVDSENQKNLLLDAWRMNQLQKHLSAKNHPYHKFATGNMDTLDIHPKNRRLDIRQELLKFYSENYSANLMHLVIYSKDDLDKCESLVRSKFQDIPNKDRECITFPGQPCDSENLQIHVKAVPIKEGHKLKFVWPVSPGIRHYKAIPNRYLAHLIGHEGKGSLFYILKEKEHFEDIVGLLFKYIRLLQKSGPCQWIFDEIAAISETSFNFQDKTHPIHYVVNIAVNMQFYPPSDWLVGSSLPSEFNPEIIKSTLKELSPCNVRIFWKSSKFKQRTNLTEPWYGTKYSVERLTGSTIEEWVKRASGGDLHLPAPNVFIPKDLSLKTVEEGIKLPVLLRKTAFSRLWYKPDTAFSTPKAYVKIDFNCPFSGNSPESEVLTEIFTRMLMDSLNDYAYDAEVARLYYSVSKTDYGFQVTVVGYNHKLRVLLETVIKKLLHLK